MMATETRQTYKEAMSSNLLLERRCSKTYAIHIVSDSLPLDVILHRASSILYFLAGNNCIFEIWSVASLSCTFGALERNAFEFMYLT